jgi:hypothetical protein
VRFVSDWGRGWGRGAPPRAPLLGARLRGVVHSQL